MTSLTLKARETFAYDRYATEATGISIEEVQPNHARCSVVLLPRHRNAMGAVMGGVIFTLADLAFAAAANSGCLADNTPLAWVSFDTHVLYLAQPHGNTLTATATCLRQGRTTCAYSITVSDEEGTPIAMVTTSGIHLPQSKIN